MHRSMLHWKREENVANGRWAWQPFEEEGVTKKLMTSCCNCSYRLLFLWFDTFKEEIYKNIWKNIATIDTKKLLIWKNKLAKNNKNINILLEIQRIKLFLT